MQLQWEHKMASGFYQCRHWMIQEGYFCLKEVVEEQILVLFSHVKPTGADTSIGLVVLPHRMWSLD